MPPVATQSKRILFVSGAGFLPGAPSGADISLHALCERLKAAGGDPIVVCAPPVKGDAGGWPVPGYPVIRLPEPLEAMKEMIGVLAPDAVVVRGPWPAIEAARWAAAAPHRKLHVYLTAATFEFAFPAAAVAPAIRYAADSPFLARLARVLTAGPADCIPPLVEPADYRCAPEGDAILFVDPVPDNGAHLATAIAERLRHRRFLFAQSPSGGPHAEVSLPNVEMVAPAPNMRALYEQARLVLVPSLREESGCRMVREAQVSGIPAVASDRGGLREAVGPGGTVLALGEPIERWCEAVEALLGDPARHAAASRAALAEAERPERAPEHIVARFLEFAAS